MLSGFFVVSAALAAIGLDGVIFYIVAMRRNEIGIRIALGASRSSVAAVVLRQTVLLLAVGVVIGVAVAFGGCAQRRLIALRSSARRSLGLVWRKRASGCRSAGGEFRARTPCLLP